MPKLRCNVTRTFVPYLRSLPRRSCGGFVEVPHGLPRPALLVRIFIIGSLGALDRWFAPFAVVPRTLLLGPLQRFSVSIACVARKEKGSIYHTGAPLAATHLQDVCLLPDGFGRNRLRRGGAVDALRAGAYLTNRCGMARNELRACAPLPSAWCLASHLSHIFIVQHLVGRAASDVRAHFISAGIYQPSTLRTMLRRAPRHTCARRPGAPYAAPGGTQNFSSRMPISYASLPCGGQTLHLFACVPSTLLLL
jgi:hypothetical protein